MPDKGTKKKVTVVEGGDSSSEDVSKEKKWTPTDESKGKALKFRIFAFISWFAAIGCEVWAIFKLREVPVNTIWLIALIVAALIFAVIGSLLWKKANRYSPASEKDKIRFFIQNQLGLIMSIIAFLPLVILIFTSKNMKGKQKGLVGAIAVIAMVIAGYMGIDFNPPSIEKYTAETEKVESLMGRDHVYWTKSGTKYHTYSDCYHINTDRTEEIFSGTVAQARKLKNITQLCITCEKRAEREKRKKTRRTTEVQEE